MALDRASLDPTLQAFLIQYSGTVSLSCLRAGVDAQAQSGSWHLPCVIDTSRVTALDIPFHDIDALLAYVRQRTRELGQRGPLAVVAPDDRVFAHAQLYDVSAVGFLGHLRHVVRSMDAARAWVASMRPAET